MFHRTTCQHTDLPRTLSENGHSPACDSSVEQLASLSRMSSGRGTDARFAKSKQTSTVFWVAQWVMESTSYNLRSYAKLFFPTRVKAPMMRANWPALIS